MNTVPLGELFATDGGSVDPRLTPNETFELWSIPAYDKGSPELRTGAEIGSAKKRLAPDDVLLSRIVPHIRRAWVVGPESGRKQIGSSEWIVFRNRHFVPEYLRHFLLSDIFHSQFMKTVAGVGGSLLRARPDRVAQINVALPPVGEQRRIAAILDQADALRSMRQRSIRAANAISQSLLRDLLRRKTDEWITVPLSGLVRDGDNINYGVVQPGEDFENGRPLVRVANVVDNDFSEIALKQIDPKIEAQYVRSRIVGDEILVACVGSIGAIANANLAMKGYNIARAVARIPADYGKINRRYLAEYLRSEHCQRYFQSEIRVVAQPTLNIKQLCETKICVPPRAVQNRFAEQLVQCDRVARMQLEHQDMLDNVFIALQFSAFRSEHGASDGNRLLQFRSAAAE